MKPPKKPVPPAAYPDPVALQRKICSSARAAPLAPTAAPRTVSDSAAAIPNVLVGVAMVIVASLSVPEVKAAVSAPDDEPLCQPVAQSDQPVRLGDEEKNDEHTDNDALAHVEDAGIEHAAEEQRAQAR